MRRIAEHLEMARPPARVDPTAWLLDGEAFLADGYALDSFDLVDALTGIEEELDVRLVDGDLQALGTLENLAGAIARLARPETLSAFRARWSA